MAEAGCTKPLHLATCRLFSAVLCAVEKMKFCRRILIDLTFLGDHFIEGVSRRPMGSLSNRFGRRKIKILDFQNR